MNEIFKLGNKLPDWYIASIDGGRLPSVNDFRGKAVLILFFSMHCPGCKGRALPFANRMVLEHGEELEVIGIHTRFEGPSISDEALIKVKKDYYLRFPIYKDTGLAATFFEYEAGGTPHWIIVDKEGIAVDSIFGSDPNRGLLRLDLRIKELLHKA